MLREGRLLGLLQVPPFQNPSLRFREYEPYHTLLAASSLILRQMVFRVIYCLFKSLLNI